MHCHCRDCKFHSGRPLGPDGRRECRANPPTMGMDRFLPGETGGPYMLAVWPLTLGDDGCGGFQHRDSDPAQEIASAAPAKTRKKGEG